MDGFVVILLVLFFLVEAMVEMIQVFKEGPHLKVVVSFVLGAVLSWFFGVDLFGYLGVIPMAYIPVWVVIIINSLFMGIMVARYAGEVNGLLEILKGFKVEAQSRF